MKTTIEFLDAVKEKHGIPSDYALAKALKVSKQTISGYRYGKSFFDDAHALMVAELLDLEPAYVMACAHAERAKKDDEKRAWQTIIERLGGMAAGLALAVGLSAAPSPADASQHEALGSVYYVKSRRRKYQAVAEAAGAFLLGRYWRPQAPLF